MKTPIATLGDIHQCPLHGTTSIVSGDILHKVNGKPIACVGDKTGCGATIIEGVHLSKIGGKAVAYQGAKTSHGGVIISGDSTMMVEV